MVCTHYECETRSRCGGNLSQCSDAPCVSPTFQKSKNFKHHNLWNLLMSDESELKCYSLLKREMDTFVDRDKAGWGSKVVTLHSRQRPIYNVSQSFWSFQHFSRNDIWHKLPFAWLSIIIKQNLNFKECFDQIYIKNSLQQKYIL